MKSTELRAQVVALDFYATWRGPYLAEPALAGNKREKSKKGPLALASKRRPT